MSVLLRCDTCGATVAQTRRLPDGWKISAEYITRNARKIFQRMRHACPECPSFHREPTSPDMILPICSAREAHLEIEEAARFAAMDDRELKGSSRKLLVRALAMLDAARARMP